MKKQSNLKRLMGYAGRFRVLTYLSWVLSGLSALLALAPYWYIWRIIQEALAVMPDFSQARNLTHLGWMAVVSAVLSFVIYIAGLMCSHLSAFRVASSIRKETMRHIASWPLGQAEVFGSGRLRKTVNECSGATETYLAHQLPDKAGALVTPCGLLALLMAFDWRLGLISLIPVALGFLLMMKMTGKTMQENMGQYQNALEDMSNQAVEYVRGVPVVKTFGQTVFSFKKFKDSIERYGKWAIGYTIECRKPMIAYTVAINSVFAFLIAAGVWFTRGGVTPEFLLNLLFYVIITPVISLTLTRIMYQSENKMIVEDALKRIDTVLNVAPLPESSTPAHPKDASVALKNVAFSYDGTKNAVDGVTLAIPSGATAAFVGPSGGGKSTLASLIARFFDPQQGEIRIGGVNVKDIPKAELMDTVSFVFQNSRLIKGTIADNVRLARPSATDAEVLAALKAAQCMDIVEKFPQGVHTVIGTKGTYLSGGEQQRVAIARAFLKNSPVVILDEATAFADPDNESRVQAAFTQLCQGRTVIMIAHRLSTVVNADQIFVLKEGKIAESGNSKDLLRQGGLFAAMWQEYQKAISWKVAKEETA